MQLLLIFCARRSIPPDVAGKESSRVRPGVSPLGNAARRRRLRMRSRRRSSRVNFGRSRLDLPSAGQMKQLHEENQANALTLPEALAAELVKILDGLASGRGSRPCLIKGPVSWPCRRMAADVAHCGNSMISISFCASGTCPARTRPSWASVTVREIFRGFFSRRLAMVRPFQGEYKYWTAEVGARDSVAELHTESTLRHFPIPPDLDDFFARSVLCRTEWSLSCEYVFTGRRTPDRHLHSRV